MNMRKSVYAAALAVVLPFVGAAKTVIVPAGETLEFAGNGRDCADNNSQNVVDLGAGATLKMTIGPFTTAVTLWTDVQVTNGTAYLDFEAVGAASRYFRGGVIRKGEGRLVIRNVKTLNYGMHTDGGNRLDPRPLDGAAVEFEDSDATGLKFAGDVVLLSLPSKYTFSSPTERYFYLASTDRPLLGVDDGITLSDKGFCNVFVRTSASVAGTVTVPANCEFHLANRSATDLTVACDVVLDGGKLVSDAKGTANRLNGTISGTGTVRLDNKLVLSQDTVDEGVSFDIGSGRILAFASPTVDIKGEVYGIGYISLIDLLDGQTVTVGTVRGQVTAAGSGTLVPQTIAPWGIVRHRSGAQVSIDPAWISSGKVVKVANVYDGWLATDGGVVDLAKVNVAADTQMTISLDSGNAVLKGKRENVTVEVKEGATVTLDESSDGQAIVANGGRMVVLPDASWQEKTIVWLDAAQEGALQELIKDDDVVTFTNDYHLVDTWYDRLRGETSYLGFNDRHLVPTDKTFYLHLYPYRVTGGLNGYDYLSFGTMNARSTTLQSGSREQRRLPFRQTKDKINAEVSMVKPKFAFVVFGSQFGGGGGILSTKSTSDGDGGFLKRKAGASGGGTLADPITEKSCTLYVDGELKDGAETYFNGGWQIFSIPVPDGNRINGLGSRRGVNDPGGDDGGQNYAEVILLNEVPSDLMRYQIEMYLAMKWGLLGSYKGQPVSREIRVTGDCTVEAQSSIVIGGAFRGTVETAAGVSVARDDGLVPPSADEIPSEGRVTWFDPSEESTLRRNTLCKAFDATKEIYAIYDREKGNVAGARIAIGSGPTSAGQNVSVDRCPHLESIAYTPVGQMNWIDFNNVYTNYQDDVRCGDKQGNTLRLIAAPGDGTSTVLATADIRMAFVIQNSVRGGGSPTLDTGVTSGTMGGGARKTSDFRDPIWRSGADAVIKNGVTYLDGRPVDGFTQGFGGRPELFAFQTEGGAYPLACFSSLYNSERVFNGEIIGETITYDRVLSETERRQVEAYLMDKWLATLPEGYTDVRRATVKGAGTYEATSAAALPTFDSGFTGTLKLEQTAFAFTADKTGVKGDLAVVPAGTLALPAEVTVVVDWQSRPAAGLYPLVAGNALGSGTTFACSFKGGAQPAVAEFVRNEKGVFLSVVKPGAMLIIR